MFETPSLDTHVTSDSPVTLRRLTIDDTDEYYDKFDENRRHFAQYDPELASCFQFRESVAEQLSTWNQKDRHHFAIMREDEFVGATILAIGRNAHAEMMYWVDRNHVRQGIATQACRQLINHAFLTTGTRHIEAVIAETNTASINTAKQLGMKLDRYHEDSLIYALHAEEMLKNSAS